MRQAGVLAAAGLVALQDAGAHLAADHRAARELAGALRRVEGLQVTEPVTNIVMVDVQVGDAAELVAQLARRGVLAATVGRQRVRFVTHRDLRSEAVVAAAAAAAAWREHDAR
jgi:threonine aldolase